MLYAIHRLSTYTQIHALSSAIHGLSDMCHHKYTKQNIIIVNKPEGLVIVAEDNEVSMV